MKYKLTDETKEVYGITLHRIEALRDFGGVKKGDKGGFVEKEANLSQDGNAWVGGNAEVYGDARVFGNARVSGDAWVYGNALVCGDADILWVSKIGSRLGTTTIYRNKDGGVSVTCGCFIGTLKDFEKQVERTHGDNKFGREYKALIELIKIHFEVEK